MKHIIMKLQRLNGILLATILLAACSIQKGVNTKSNRQLNNEFTNAAAQYKVMMKVLPDGRFPKTYENGELKTSGSDWWCSGFYPGSLLYIYQQTNDTAIYNEAIRSMALLKKEQFNTKTHDIGFMMYCSFGNAEQMHPNKEDEEILMNSAKSLATRFDPLVGCIRSWDSTPDDFLVIIDNMMNLELLFWATKHSGDSSFYKIAVTHANTTMKNHFRPDYSSYHVVNYNPKTGEVKKKRTAQGASDSSAWARGQGWGLYGYTVLYRETKDVKYLNQAKHIAHFILTNPTLPSDKIPYWDFNAPGIPNALRDASAAAVIASGLLELQNYVDKKNRNEYIFVAKKILQSLSSEKYTATPGTNGGFILHHGVGHIPQKTEVDVPLTYADYYFLEAMTRYKALNTKNQILPKPPSFAMNTTTPERR